MSYSMFLEVIKHSQPQGWKMIQRAEKLLHFTGYSKCSIENENLGTLITTVLTFMLMSTSKHSMKLKGLCL